MSAGEEAVAPGHSPARRPQVVVLNGVGSVGKSSTARALQAIAAKPLLHVAMDAFLHMLPRTLFGQPDGLVFEPIPGQGGPCVAVRSGPAVEQAMRGMRRAVAAMAAQGNDLIVDEVMLDGAKERNYRTLLAPFDARFVALHAPLEVLEAREQARGDRMAGLARWQFGRVHRGIAYDLEIDTATATPAECARVIRDAFGL